MFRTLLALPVVFFMSVPSAPAPAAGPGAILAMQKALFAAIDRGDAEAAKAFVASDRKGPGGMTSVFLVDGSGKALRATDSGSARDVLAKLAAESKAAGGTFETKISSESAECPDSNLSYAVIEFERAHAIDGRKETRSYRGTLLVRWEEESWKLCHWHVSPSAPGQ